MQDKNQRNGLEIAIIGMSGRFPGANNLQEFWENLKNGINSIYFFNEEELRQNSNINPAEIQQPNYIKAKGIIHNVEYFDAGFFGYSPGEAELLDPQVRIFYEICWEALEDAGCDPSTYNGSIGVYAGGTPNISWEMLTVISGKQDMFGNFALASMTDKDYLSTRISYKLDLKGTAVTMNTACSTSLVGLDLASRGLLTGQCDAALVGGVSATVENARGSGYLYQEGFINSPDGIVRTFDARAKGVVFSHGAGVVLLKRLDDAILERDNIYAVIKGFAVNNDGMDKSSFAAPAVQGQTRCIRTALELSGLDPGTITYLEAHGTATELGDVIEMEALKTAFRTDKKQYCALGSVKTNIGHLDAAAGIVSLIKVVLMMQHRQIPPSLNYEIPNPNIDFENSPFFINTGLQEWKSNGWTLRAGVSSFGVGGTNAHVILEEWTGVSEPGDKADRPDQLLLFSARTANALEQMSKNLAGYLKANPGVNLADVAYSLKPGRKTFEHRRMLVCPTVQAAIDILEAAEAAPNIQGMETFYGKEEKQVVFMFPGQGSQYVNMGRGIYETETLFHEEINHCFEILKPLLNFDLKEVLYPSDRSDRSDQTDILINQTEIAQPMIFVIEYALAKLLMSWGIEPYAMVGHSIGEYVAASLSGVFSLEDALYIVSQRGKLMQQMPPGEMISVTLPEPELKRLLIDHSELDLAAVNGSTHGVVSGPPAAIEAVTRQLEKNHRQYRLLHTSHAYHSQMMDPILKPFARAVAKVKRHAPELPFISNVSGSWITDQEAADPRYWANHLRQTVRFAAGLSELLKDKQTIFIEVGPGRTLSTLVRQHPGKQPQQMVINLVRHPHEEAADEYYLLSKLGQVWLYGKEPAWQGFYTGEKRHKLRLPTYPWQRQRFWLEGNPAVMIKQGQKRWVDTGKKPDIANWFYIPSWKCSILSPAVKKPGEKVPSPWLVFAGDKPGEFESRLVDRFASEPGNHLVVVRPGKRFSQLEDGPTPSYRSYTIDPAREEDYTALIKTLQDNREIPGRIIHLWNLNVPGQDDDRWQLESQGLEEALESGFYSFLYLVKALGHWGILMDKPEIHLLVVTNGMYEAWGKKVTYPQKAVIQGPIMTIPHEYPGMKCCCIDLETDITGPGPGDDDAEHRGNNQQWLIDQLLKEASRGVMAGEVMIAYRENYRLVRCFEPAALRGTGTPVLHLKEGGVYLISGGLGGIGLVIARHLAETLEPKLILTGRSRFPAKNQWEQWLKTHDDPDSTSRKIRKVQELEALGAEVRIYSMDTADRQGMQKMIEEVKEEWGTIHGVIHAAGVPGGVLIQLKTREIADRVLSPKIKGTLALHFALQEAGIHPHFMVLCSSTSSLMPAVGQMDYSAGNAFMDAFAFYSNAVNKHHTFTVSINWDSWQEVGMAVEQLARQRQEKKNLTRDFESTADQGDPLKNAISPAEGIEALNRILGAPFPQVAVSPLDLAARLETVWELTTADLAETILGSGPRGTAHPRPEISTTYEAPVNRVEQQLANIWQMILGIDQVGISDDFFELGGDSLKAAAMISIIHKNLNVKLALAEVFNKPHIRKLAAFIQEEKQDRFTAIQPVEKQEYYPLSPAQKRLYIMQQMDPQITAYNIPVFFFLRETTDIVKLETAFKKLLQRQESLRTSFEMVAGEPIQHIHERVEFEIEYYEMKKAEVKAEEDRSLRLEGTGGLAPLPIGNSQPETALLSSFIRPFDLARAPLLRLGLITYPHTSPLTGSPAPGNNEPKDILMVDIHHIITDGISIGIFIKEIDALYGETRLTPLRIQYKDYTRWQNRKIGQETMKIQEEYWLREFSGEIPVLEMPVDFVRPLVQDFSGSLFSFELNKEETMRLKAFALEQGTTLFNLLLAIYYLFLYRVSGQEDIVVGAPLAGRRHSDLAGIIGMFINTLALRNFPTKDKNFKQFLEEIKTRNLQAFENQDYQYEELVEKVAVNRDIGRNPLFDVMLVLQNLEIPGIKTNSPDLILKPFAYHHGISKFDLTFQCIETGETLWCSFEYSTKLFKANTIARFSEYFKKLMSAVLENPSLKPTGIEILSEKEKQQMLVEFNDTAADYPKEKTIHEFFALQVNQTPDYIAVVGSWELHHKGTRGLAPLSTKVQGTWELAPLSNITYKELNNQSDRLSLLLRRKGVTADTIVSIMMERSTALIIGLLAILKAGAAYLPIDPDYPQERIDYLLKDSDAKILLTEPGLSEKFEKLLIVNCQLLIVNENPPHRRRYNNPPKEVNSINNYQLTIDNLQLESSNLAYIIYTSGTTGKPRGVPIRHTGFINLVGFYKKAFEVSPGDRISQVAGISFDGMAFEVWGCLLNGGTLVIVDQETRTDPSKIKTWLVKNQINLSYQPTVIAEPLIGEETDWQGASIRVMQTAGERLTRYPVPQLPFRFYNLYGPTEDTVWTTWYEVSASSREKYPPIGKPIANHRVFILGQGNVLQPPGITGELCISGDGQALGYLNNPELTAKKFDHDLWPYQDDQDGYPRSHRSHKSYIIYRTGDLARWLPDGNIEFLGRQDFQVKIRGFRIEPGEIETQLLKHDKIKNALVTAGTSKYGDKYLCAYIVTDNENHETIIPQLREFLSRKLPAYMIPAYFVILDRIPLTPNGKVDSKALPEPGLTIGDMYIAPRGHLEQQLLKIWSQVLDLDPGKISIDANFFQLGGHSLKATIMTSRIDRDFNVKVPLTEVFRIPTVRQLADYIRTTGKYTYAGIEPIENKEFYPLSPAQERLYILQQLDINSTIYNIQALIPLAKAPDVKEMTGIFKTLIRRHESLRTSFPVLDEKPVQRIHDQVEFEIEYYDMKEAEEDRSLRLEGTGGLAPMSFAPLSIEPATRSSHPAAALLGSFIRPFDLCKAPLLRVGLFELPHTPAALRGHPSPEGKKNEYILMVDLHHIIADGISVQVLRQEFNRVKTGNPLPALKLQYRDYSEWFNSKKQKDTHQEQENYWLKMYNGKIPVLNIPTDYPRPAVQSFAGNRQYFELEKEKIQALKEIALEENVTTYMILLAVFNVMLSLLTGQEDIILGTDSAGRQHADLEQVIGMLVNTLALRNFPAKEKTFKEFLGEIRQNTLAAFKNQDYQFENLVEKLSLKIDPGRNPLFDIMFTFRTIEPLPGETHTSETAPSSPQPAYEFENNTAKFDLLLDGIEVGNHIFFILEYRTNLFKEETIKNYIKYFKEIISAVIKKIDIQLKDIEISHDLMKAKNLTESIEFDFQVNSHS